MRRREVLGIVGGSAVLWSLSAHAQQPGKLPTIGILGTATPAAQGQWIAALIQRLRELGWSESRIAIDLRWAEGRSESYVEIAAQFVRLNVDVIVTLGGAVLAAKRATAAIPIVFAVAADPVSSGFVSNLARPGGNVTGLSNLQSDLGAKRLELLREVVPGFRRLAILSNVGFPATVLETDEVMTVARALGLEVIKLEIRRGE